VLQNEAKPETAEETTMWCHMTATARGNGVWQNKAKSKTADGTASVVCM
jgi:hypothetical protein